MPQQKSASATHPLLFIEHLTEEHTHSRTLIRHNVPMKLFFFSVDRRRSIYCTFPLYVCVYMSLGGETNLRDKRNVYKIENMLKWGEIIRSWWRWHCDCWHRWEIKWRIRYVCIFWFNVSQTREWFC